MSLTATTIARHSSLLWPDDAQLAGEHRIGGKAAGLVRLRSLGARVPEWFVIGADAFDDHLHRTRVARVVAAELGALRAMDPAARSARAAIEKTADTIRAHLARTSIDPVLTAAVSDALDALGGSSYAVRSSGLGEDSGTHSFAGQFDSFIGLRGAESVAAGILDCWRSAFGARALAYRLQAGQLDAIPAMAVVVQRVAEGTASGVTFTIDPRTGRKDHALIAACYGLGESLVSGEGDADEILVGADGSELSCIIADKALRTEVRRGDAGGTVRIRVRAALRRARALSPEEARTVAAECRRIAIALGRPQDIEWTLEDGAPVLLQARPVTSRVAVDEMPPASPVDAPSGTGSHRAPGERPSGDTGQVIVWDNSNIQESYCGVTTPLTFSFAVAAYASVYEQTMRALGIPEPVIASHRPMLGRLLGLVRGRIYYNIESWYRGLLLLPSFGRNKADMEAMMGLDTPVDFIAGEDASLLARLRRLPRVAVTGARLLFRFAQLPRAIPRFHDRTRRYLGSIDRETLGQRSMDELHAMLEMLRVEVVERWETPIVNDFHVMIATGRLRRAVRAVAGADAERLVQALLTGIEGVESTEPPKALWHLAMLARGSAPVCDAIRQQPAADALRTIGELHPEMATALHIFLERWGDRCMGELKLESRSLRDDPDFLIGVLRNYIDQADAPAPHAHGEAPWRTALAELDERLGLPGRLRMRRMVHAAHRGIRARESLRLERTRLFGAHRDIYRAIGMRLHEARVLDDPTDVFYLTTDEIAGCCDGTAPSNALAATARLRRDEFRGYESEDLPNRIVTRGAVSLYRPPAPDPQPSSGGGDAAAIRVLRGSGCSAGRARGSARVLRTAADDLDINGRVLVALRTDPGWAPLFPTVAGIVVERGSTLSHSAVLARELGIPAVVGIPGLLAVIRDGEQVSLDGTTGTVELLDRT